MLVCAQHSGSVDSCGRISPKTKHLFAPAYMPQANGLVERLMQPLRACLAALVDDQKNWPRMLPFVVFACSTSQHANPQARDDH